MSHDPVPFMNLSRQHAALEEEMLAAIAPLLRDAAFIGGDPVSGFEEAFASVHDLPHAVTVKSGTSALRLAMEALGIGPGDEVLVPAFTFIATAASVVHAGATPVFVDVDPELGCLDPTAAAAAVTERTRGMIPVHLFGHPAPMKDLMALAARHDLRVIEDCAQSHLARLEGRPTGSFGDIAAYSFYPSKNLGSAGDAGCVVTRDPSLADRVRRLANHGRTDRYFHEFLGYNERLDAIQAAALAVKLRHLPGWTARRRDVAARYDRGLDGLTPLGAPLRLPVTRSGAEPVYHLYVVRHPERDALAEALDRLGVGTATHYPTTLPAQPAFQALGLGEGDYPHSEAWARDVLSLPFFPELTEPELDRVVEAVRSLSR